MFFFFFQAEDGIRDLYVTGVQTCALPISFDVKPDDVFFWFTDIGWMMGPWEMIGVTFWGGTMVIYEGAPNFPTPDRVWRSEERRVGKECRSRWSTEQEKQKKAKQQCRRPQ